MRKLIASLVLIANLGASAADRPIVLENATYEGNVTVNVSVFAAMVGASMMLFPYDTFNQEKMVVKTTPNSIEFSFIKSPSQRSFLAIVLNRIVLEYTNGELYTATASGPRMKVGHCTEFGSKYCLLEETNSLGRKSSFEIVFLENNQIGVAYEAGLPFGFDHLFAGRISKK